MKGGEGGFVAQFVRRAHSIGDQIIRQQYLVAITNAISGWCDKQNSSELSQEQKHIAMGLKFAYLQATAFEAEGILPKPVVQLLKASQLDGKPVRCVEIQNHLSLELKEIELLLAAKRLDIAKDRFRALFPVGAEPAGRFVPFRAEHAELRTRFEETTLKNASQVLLTMNIPTLAMAYHSFIDVQRKNLDVLADRPMIGVVCFLRLLLRM